MELLKIIKASYVEGYKINLLFNNHFSAVVDLKNAIFTDKREIFKKLENIDFFRNFTQNRWTVEWENGVDLAPEFLYELAKKQQNISRV
ncbi:MAG: DUF2442 domain-containing protein [Flavobacteriaceae bacterium]|nr:DUF2442 domain-containing protein [Flavobacteriaceae bacterium]